MDLKITTTKIEMIQPFRPENDIDTPRRNVPVLFRARERRLLATL